MEASRFPGATGTSAATVTDPSTPGVALVTGAARGIGRAVAERLAADGFSVVGVDRVAAGDLPFALLEADLADTDRLGGLVDRVENLHGPLTALVNVAGVYERLDPAAFSLESYRRVLAVDLDAPIVLSAGAGSRMATRGFGRIVNVTSVHGRFGERGGLAYDTAKGGLDQATRTLGLEFSGRDVLVNAVAPGFVETDMAIVDGVLETSTDAFRAVYLDGGRLPIGRAAQPADVASLVAWLVSRDNTYVTGQVIAVDGGLTTTF